MKRTANGYRVFLQQFWRRYHTTGAILPSGRRLAAALCRYIKDGTGPRSILEVGPGTGPATAEIVRRLEADDHLWIVELNEAFVEHLRSRFENESAFRAVADRCEIVHDAVQNLPNDRRYDLVISGLPLNNFDLELVESLLATFERLLKPGGVISFFEYIAIRRAKAALSGARTASDCRASRGRSTGF